MIFSGDYSYELDNVERSGERGREKKRRRKQEKECRPRGSGGRESGVLEDISIELERMSRAKKAERPPRPGSRGRQQPELLYHEFIMT